MNTLRALEFSPKGPRPLQKSLRVAIYMALGLLLLISPASAQPVTSTRVFEFSGVAFHQGTQEDVSLAGRVHLVTIDPIQPDVHGVATLQSTSGIGLTSGRRYRADGIDNVDYRLIALVSGEVVGEADFRFDPSGPILSSHSITGLFTLRIRVLFNEAGEMTGGSASIPSGGGGEDSPPSGGP